MEVVLNAEQFYQRLEHLQDHWYAHKSTVWGSSDALCIPLGAIGDELNYSKSSSLHIYLFGYEFADSLIVITKNNFYFMATAKKCGFVQEYLSLKHESIKVHVLVRTKDEGQNRQHFNDLANVIRRNGGKRLGTITKGDFQGQFIPSWMTFVEQSQIEKVDISSSIGLLLAIKDKEELDLCKRAAVLSNKIMKHGFVAEMEKILDAQEKVTHDELSKKVEAILLDPSKINIKVSADSIDACYSPIVQSGGRYDIKPSAVSDTDPLSGDVILCSIGARYKGYCANLSRTYMVDVPPKVERLYATLLSLYDACLEQMVPGNELRQVLEGAKSFLKKKDSELLNYLPKTLGFALGLEFRDNTMLLNAANTAKFAEGMVFNLSVGLHNIPLSKEDTKGCPETIRKLTMFSLLLADVVAVQQEGQVPEIFTKISKDFSDVSYKIGEKDEEEEEVVDVTEERVQVRRSERAKDEKMANEVSTQNREKKQKELMERKLAEARRRLLAGDGAEVGEESVEQFVAKDLAVYRNADEYPRDAVNTRLKVDLEKEALLVPVGGQLVPFHISVIKSMTAPDPDMRINFYCPGAALGKEVAKNTQQLVIKYGKIAVFIKELTFRSMDGKNLPQVFQQFQELRRRVRQREQKAEQEKDLVVQTELIKIRDQRIPRLQEVTMRPQLSGRKCVGTLEAHQNGLRFTSTKTEKLDVMYSNVKHAIFQPCDRTTMVLVHFHLKDFILIGKKKHKDVQFFTEVIETSENLESSKRSAYDPDELDGEQREREMRRRLNVAFRDFCEKVQKVAVHYDFNLQMDAPFRKSSFQGNWSKEMVVISPTTNALVNLTEWPPFVLTLADVEHAHFERVTFATKAFDLTFIFKNWDVMPRTITAIDTKYMDIIQDWLNLVEITFTKGPRSMNWSDVMKLVREQRAVFYDDVDDDGAKKPAGWLLLSADGSDDEEEEEEDEDSDFDEQEDDDSEEGSDDDDDDGDDDESSFEEDSEGSYDEEEEEALEEKGMDWEELENDARRADSEKRKLDVEEPAHSNKKNKNRR